MNRHVWKSVEQYGTELKSVELCKMIRCQFVVIRWTVLAQHFVAHPIAIARALPDSPARPLLAFGLPVSVSFGLRPPS
eukprot:7068582-Heterocapsa_arctica.AAC.1